MNRKELIDRVKKNAKVFKISKPEVQEIVYTTISEIEKALLEGEEVILKKFGCFYPEEMRGRVTRHPSTGKEAIIAPRLRIRFKTSETFKRKLMSIKPKFLKS